MKNELNVYDIVIFNNPSVGTDLHRIVDKQIQSDSVTFDYLSFDEVNKTFSLSNDISHITTSVIKFDSFVLHGYSETEYNNGLYLNYYSKKHDLEVQSTFLNDKNIYEFTLSLTNDRSTKSRK